MSNNLLFFDANDFDWFLQLFCALINFLRTSHCRSRGATYSFSVSSASCLAFTPCLTASSSWSDFVCCDFGFGEAKKFENL